MGIRFQRWVAAIVLAAGAAAAADAEGLVIACAACHGQDGASAIAPNYPNLAGQNERYLLRQLELIKSGKRAAPLMAGQLANLTDENLREIAAYYAAMAGSVGRSSQDNLDVGRRIYRGGIMTKGVASCTACHSPTGAGNAPAGFPRLSGQPVDYVVEQLTAFREGQRTTDEEYGGMMQQVASSLTDKEIKAVANYVLGLH